jgi:hypothetical protein
VLLEPAGRDVQGARVVRRVVGAPLGLVTDPVRVRGRGLRCVHHQVRSDPACAGRALGACISCSVVVPGPAPAPTRPCTHAAPKQQRQSSSAKAAARAQSTAHRAPVWVQEREALRHACSKARRLAAARRQHTQHQARLCGGVRCALTAWWWCSQPCRCRVGPAVTSRRTAQATNQARTARSPFLAAPVRPGVRSSARASAPLAAVPGVAAGSGVAAAADAGVSAQLVPPTPSLPAAAAPAAGGVCWEGKKPCCGVDLGLLPPQAKRSMGVCPADEGAPPPQPPAAPAARAATAPAPAPRCAACGVLAAPPDAAAAAAAGLPAGRLRGAWRQHAAHGDGAACFHHIPTKLRHNHARSCACEHAHATCAPAPQSPHTTAHTCAPHLAGAALALAACCCGGAAVVVAQLRLITAVAGVVL